MQPQQLIIEKVCSFFGYTETQLKSKSRKGSLPDARVICGKFIYKYVTPYKREVSRILGQNEEWFGVVLPRFEGRAHNPDSRYTYIDTIISPILTNKTPTN